MTLIQSPKRPLHCLAYSPQSFQGFSVIYREISIDGGHEIARVVCVEATATEFCIPNVWYGGSFHHGRGMVGDEVESNITGTPYNISVTTPVQQLSLTYRRRSSLLLDTLQDGCS